MGDEIVELIEEARNRQQIWSGLNVTFLSLIHK